MVIFNLFFAFFKIGLFAFGGGGVFMPLIEKEVVYKYNWLTKEEFLDMLGINQILPGAISVKFATYTGYKIGGIIGAIIANIGNILPPILLMILFSMVYKKYKPYPVVKDVFSAIQLAVFAMIIAMAFQIIDIQKLTQIKSIVIVALSFIAFINININPALIILFAGILGIIWR